MRKFKCIDNKETKVAAWSQYFTPGIVYEEREIPFLKNDEKSLYLIGNSCGGWYVDKDQFEEVKEEEHIPWKKYRRIGHSEMRPYILGEDLTDVSVASEDNPEFDFGMIARNPNNHKDQWYVARDYFNENLEEITEN